MKAQKGRSLQSIHKLRQKETFVGRENEENIFQKNFKVDEEHRIFIFNVFGQGGVGKTSLLLKFSHLAEELHAVNIWNDETQKSVLEILENISKQFEKKNYELKKFNKNYETYKKLCQDLVASNDAPAGIADFIGSLSKTGLRIGRHSPVGIVFDFIDEDAVAKGVSNLANSFLNYFKDKLSAEETRLVQNPIEELTKVFFEDLWELLQEHLAVFFFDTYEYSCVFLEEWIIDCLAGKYGDIPANIVWVIAGREELDRNRWDQFLGLSMALPLEPFEELEVQKYLHYKGIVSEEVIKAIWQISKGLPLMVAILAMGQPNSHEQLRATTGIIVDRILKWIEDPEQRQVVINASLPLEFNENIVSLLVEEAQQDLFGWLKHTPFVQERSSGWKYHDVIRPQMLRYKRLANPQEWKRLHGILADYYLQSGKNLEVQSNQKLALLKSGDIWQDLRSKEVYHRLCQNLYANQNIALDSFMDDYSVSNIRTHLWAEIIKKAGEDTEDHNLIEWGNILLKGTPYYFGSNCQAVLTMLDKLITNDFVRGKYYETILIAKFQVCKDDRQYSELLKVTEELIDLKPNDVLYLLLHLVALALARREGDKDEFNKKFTDDEFNKKFIDNMVKIEKLSPGTMEKIVHTSFEPQTGTVTIFQKGENISIVKGASPDLFE